MAEYVYAFLTPNKRNARHGRDGRDRLRAPLKHRAILVLRSCRNSNEKPRKEFHELLKRYPRVSKSSYFVPLRGWHPFSHLHGNYAPFPARACALRTMAGGNRPKCIIVGSLGCNVHWGLHCRF